MDQALKPYIGELIQYMQSQGHNVYPLPKLVFRNDSQESSSIFGKTGYYDPMEKTIVLYIHNRHPKDILRSFAHELWHHYQNLSGAFQTIGDTGEDPKYAQNNPELRKIEQDAFLNGNMIFRDYCDNKKYQSK